MSSVKDTDRRQKISEFIEELTGFAHQAETALNQIEHAEAGQSHDFTLFTNCMIAIRGTADQLTLPGVSHIAGLGEEISVKAAMIQTRHQLRKCVSSLWDALTTVKYMLENPTQVEQGPSEEQKILVHRLESVVQNLGGRRETVSSDEIENLLRSRN